MNDASRGGCQDGGCRDSATHLPAMQEMKVLRPSQYTKQQDKIKDSLSVNRLQFDRCPLIGRSQEVAVLKECLNRSRTKVEGNDNSHLYQQNRQLILIRGKSGAGKSSLALSLKQPVERMGGIFCAGKYILDARMQQSKQRGVQPLGRHQHQPLVGIATACADLCHRILRLEDENDNTPPLKHFCAIQNAIKAQMDQNLLELLAACVVGFREFLAWGPSGRGDEETGQGQGTPSPKEPQPHLSIDLKGAESPKIDKEQLKAAFRLFFRCITSQLNAPIVICLDDLQWADSLSIQVVETLLSEGNAGGGGCLMVIGCYRSDEVVDPEHLLVKAIADLKAKEAISRAQQHSANPPLLSITEMEAGNFTIPNIRELLMELLNKDNQEDEEIGHLAALVHSRTQGNVFFVKSFLSMLVEEGHLKFHVGTWQWDWNLIAMENETSATPNVVSLIHARLGRHQRTKEIIRLLQLAACLGNRLDRETLKLVWQHCDKEPDCHEDGDSVFDDLLFVVIRDNFLCTSGGFSSSRCLEVQKEEHCAKAAATTNATTLRFVHDKILEAVISLNEDFDALQYEVGIILNLKLSPERMESMIFIIANLLNAGQVQGGAGIAKLNLRAGLKAKGLASFPSMLQFAENGIRHLGDEGDIWSEATFELALELHSLAAQASYSLAQTDRSNQYCNTVLEQKRATPFQKFPVYEVKLDMLHSEIQLAGLNLCLEYLSTLGCHFPRSPLVRKVQAGFYMRETRSKFIPTEAVVRKMTMIKDPRLLQIMQLLERAGSTAYIVSEEELYILVRCRYIRIVSEHGLTPSAASAFASLGNVLFHKYGQYDMAVQLAELSVLTQNILQSNESKARTLYTAYAHVLGWVRPIRSSLKYFLEGYDAGLRSGRIISAATSIAMYLVGGFTSGMKLSLLAEDFHLYLPQMKAMHAFQLVDIILPHGQLIENLRGKSSQTTTLTGSLMDEVEQMASGEANSKTHITKWLPRLKVCACMYFGEYEEGANLVLKLGGISLIKKYFSGAGFGQEYLPFGVCCYAMAKQTNQSKFKRAANKIRNEVKVLVEKGGCVNLSHVLQILDAEHFAITRKQNKAEESYKKAIIEAARGGFLMSAAIASERYGEYLLSLQGNDASLEASYRIKEAIKLYDEWGAARKVELLQEKYASLL